MAEQTLAIKYRPKKWSDVTEQDSVKTILQNQLETNTTKNAYLFVGGAGTGKTTSARIFANEINNGEGNPIELDAASNNGVDDVRGIIQQAQTKSLDSEYKIFIIDECHAISSAGWQAFLKLIEEPPAKSIFIFCTTNPEKIPKTILSRVQRYDFKRISQDGIVGRLHYILYQEDIYDDSDALNSTMPALEYIAKIADGGMRDAITLLDKCLAYSTELTLENVVKALGTIDYDTMFKLTDKLCTKDTLGAISIIDDIHNSGKDLKQFVHLYCGFLLDLGKLYIKAGWDNVDLPRLPEYEEEIKSYDDYYWNGIKDWLKNMIQLDTNIKYSATPKMDIQAVIYINTVRYAE
jgi:DNA polymerase-3 subunit gamma/tau